MKKSLAVTTFAMIGIFINSFALGASDKQEIRTLASALLTSFKNGDTAQIKEIITSDFVEKLTNGKKLSRAEVVEQMNIQSAIQKNLKDVNLKSRKASVKNTLSYSPGWKFNTLLISRVKVHGRKAVGESRYTYTADILDSSGHMGPAGKSHLLTMERTGHAVLVKEKGKWFFQSLTSDKEVITMEGRQISVQSGSSLQKQK